MIRPTWFLNGRTNIWHLPGTGGRSACGAFELRRASLADTATVLEGVFRIGRACCRCLDRAYDPKPEPLTLAPFRRRVFVGRN